MINAKFNLAILVLDPSVNRYKILSSKADDLELPYLDIETNLDINSCLDHLVSTKIDKNDSYLNFRLTDVELSEMLQIYYLVFITYESVVKDGFLLDIQTSITRLPNNAKKILTLL
jgi:hypothetical protein